MVRPLKTLLTGLLLAAVSVMLAACNGGSSSSSSTPTSSSPQSPPVNRTVDDGVNGPLDEVQRPLSEDVFSQIIAGAEGTPLEGSLDCVRQAVVIDTIDILDAIALALSEAASSQDPAAFEAAAGNIEFSLNELANDLPGALGALTGSDCNSADNGGGNTGTNPLAGTPLEPLGEALAPVLEQFPSGGSPGSGQDADLHYLTLLTSQLAVAFQGGVASLPPEVRSAPILGGVITTLSTALNDINTTMLWFGRYNGEFAATALEGTLNRLLINTLTQIVPLAFIEEQAGQPGVISGPIAAGVSQLTSTFGENLLSVALPEVTNALNNDLAPVLDPIENTVLPAILLAAFSGLGEAQAGDNPISLLLGAVTEGLTGGSGGGSSPTGTPLDLLLGPLVDIGGGSTTCPFAGTPLDSACTLFQLLP